MTPGFYYQPFAVPVNWEEADTVVLANPEWARREPAALADTTRLLPDLPGHVWLATSGTSSAFPDRLRWVALSKPAFLASASAVNEHLGATASDVWAHALPTFHVGGLGILARAHLSGARVVPAIDSRWDAAAFRATVSESGATLSALVPSQIHDLVRGRLVSPPSLRAIVVGGARLEPPLYEQAIALGWPCLPSYGLTETCSQVATASLASVSAGRYPSAFPILSHADIRQGDDGRLWIRARSLLTCCAEIAQGDARVWDPKRDGWLETEDLGHVSGRLVEVLGRASESVKVLGELVSLTALEERAWQWAEREQLRGPEGFDLAVVALPHERLGFELVLAIVDASVPASRRNNLDASLMSFCREVLLPFERIQRMARVEAIPRTPLGKVRRQVLSALVTGRSRA